MVPGTDQIGFSQRIRLEWLDQTANLVLAGSDAAVIRAELHNILRDKVSVRSDARRCNREKTITILSRVWLSAPGKAAGLRDDALELLKHLPAPQRLAVHWGMVTAVYPFWAVVAACVGRLLRLQGSVAATHVQRRMSEQYGERETVFRATRRILRSFVDWGVLTETGIKGVYEQPSRLVVDDRGLKAWLVEASLHARREGSALVKDLLESPGLFPFEFAPAGDDDLFRSSPRLEIVRFGLDGDVAVLRNKRRSRESSRSR